ncbi:MAG: START-like domain-containing protein [Flavobacteriaceae bacterium]
MTNKKLFSIEFNFHCSPQLLFQYLSTPSGLSEWFADDVNSRGEDFTFIWEDSEEYAKLLTKKNNELVKFMWVNDEEDYKKYFFEFLITVDEITKDVSLTVTDFSDDDELEESKMLWTNLVGDLKQVLGAV